MQRIFFLLFKLLEKSFRSKKSENEVYTSVEGSKEELDETGRLTATSSRFNTFIPSISTIAILFLEPIYKR